MHPASSPDLWGVALAMAMFVIRKAHSTGIDRDPVSYGMVPLQALTMRYLSKSGMSIREIDRRSKGELDKSTLSNITRGLVYQRPTRQVERALRRWLHIPKDELDDVLSYWARRAAIIQQYDSLTDEDRAQVDHLVNYLATRRQEQLGQPADVHASAK